MSGQPEGAPAEPKTSAEFHERAAVAAEEGRKILNSLAVRLAVEDLLQHPLPSEAVTAEAARAQAYATLSMAYSSLAWSPVFTPEIQGLD